MAVRGTYRNGMRLRGALSDEEGHDDIGDEPRDEVVPIPKLRSKIVRAYSDNEEGDGDDGFGQPAGTFSRATGLGDSYSRDRQPHFNRLIEENWQKGKTDIGKHVDGSRGSFSLYENDVGTESKAKWSSVEDLGGRHPSERLDRDRDQHRVETDRGDRDGRGSTALPRDRAAVARLSPQRDDHRERDYGTRRDADRSVEVEHRRDSFADRQIDGLSKGKGKRDSGQSLVGGRESQGHQRERERGSWQRDGRDLHDRNDVAERIHTADKNSRRDRDDSLSSADARDPGAAPRAFSNFRLEREKGSLRDDGGIDRKRSTVRLRDGEREGLQDSPVPELYSVHRGTVHSIRAFGIFVRIDGYRNHGLVHLSQVSDHEVTNRNDSDAAKVEALSSIASEGEQVWVKVISVKIEDDGSVKIGCSLKYVSQGDGRDLDPNNLQLEKLQSKPAWQAPKKLELDAVYNVVCTRCGGHGHLKTECYTTGAQSYALLKDEDVEENGARSSRVTAPKSLHLGSSSRVRGTRAPTGPMGRGRAMVQPAWMKHGVGVGGDQDRATHGERTMTVAPDRPEKSILGQGSSAPVGRSKGGTRKRRDEKRHRSRHSRKEKRHGTKENRRDKHKKRHHSDDESHKRKRRRL